MIQEPIFLYDSYGVLRDHMDPTHSNDDQLTKRINQIFYGMQRGLYNMYFLRKNDVIDHTRLMVLDQDGNNVLHERLGVLEDTIDAAFDGLRYLFPDKKERFKQGKVACIGMAWQAESLAGSAATALLVTAGVALFFFASCYDKFKP